MVEMEKQQNEIWEGYVDWKGRPAFRHRHGGFHGAVFVLVVEVMENLAFLANASNLVLYLLGFMHFTPSSSSTTVTTFMATAFLLALAGGFLSNAFFSSFSVFLLSAFLQLLGLTILTVQAYHPSLQPPHCNPRATPITPCSGPDRPQAAMLYTGLYLVAAGVGGIKGSLPTHGAEQFDERTQHGRIERSTFFNYFVFCLAAGGLIATTFVVWIEDNKGWKWGFFIATISILLSIPIFLAGSPFYRVKIPCGSPLTTISKVLLAAILNNNTSNNSMANMAASPSKNPPRATPNQAKEEYNTGKETSEIEVLDELTNSLKFLNRATNNNPTFPSLNCTIKQVEEVKIVFKIFPIFASTIILNCCLAQLSTFSVQQAATMNRKLGPSFQIPPASLPIFPILIIMFLAPIYDHIIIPFARKITRKEAGVTHLQRIGIGLVLSTIAMAVAAVVEVKRKRVAAHHNMLNIDHHSSKPLPISCFWIAIQYALLGSADLFTLAGMLEFFFTEAPSSMRSLATSLSWGSLAIGYYLSSVMVSVVNGITSKQGHQSGWLSGGDLNHYHLERFYWLLCLLSGLNYMGYLLWACRYQYESTGSRNRSRLSD